ncbi:MAG: dihydroorotate dehydrogenase electron transfer subunit [Armatimonadota bacterium]|nr:dihydroorotate dehydrogenase electron transfer subunit [Armatimonadota bacterium]
MRRYEVAATVVEHQRRAPNQYELILHAPPIAQTAMPGQFVMLRPVRTHAPLWRRPYSVLRANPDKGVFSVFYSVQSTFTELLSLKPIGSTVQVLGPLGSYFQPVRAAKRHILVAGGTGAPPLCFLASRLAPTLQPDEQLWFLIGARHSDLLVGVDEFRALGAEVRVATDDGSRGYKGYVTDLLRQVLEEPTPSAVYACGPNSMLRVVTLMCREWGVPCQISVDAPMPCGIGVCLGCAVKVALADGSAWYKRACVEGPVFRAEEVVWE